MKVVVFGAGGMANGIAKFLDDEGFEFRLLDKDECDVRNFTQAHYWTEKLRPDIIICTAGISQVAEVAVSDPDNWADEIYTNLIGSYNVAKSAVDFKVQTMIFIASVAGMYGKPNHSGYCASKAGVRSLVQSLGMEGHNAYAISPGRVDTPMRERDYPNDTPGSRLLPTEIGRVVEEILNGDYKPGSNLVIRKKGLEHIIREVDDGEPWLTKLEAGKPVTI